MLNFSPEKLILVFIIALVVLGPNRLPQAARTLGRVVAEVRRLSGSFQAEVRDALVEPRDALSNVVGDLGLDSLRQSVRDSVTGVFDPPATATAPATAGTDAVTTNGATSGSGVTGSSGVTGTTAAGSTAAGSTAAGVVASAPPAPDDPAYN